MTWRKSHKLEQEWKASLPAKDLEGGTHKVCMASTQLTQPLESQIPQCNLAKPSDSLIIDSNCRTVILYAERDRPNQAPYRPDDRCRLQE